LTKESNQDQVVCLSDFIEDSNSLCAIIVEFEEGSVLTHCGGVHFYSDQAAVNKLKTLYADSQNRYNLTPLVFNRN